MEYLSDKYFVLYTEINTLEKSQAVEVSLHVHCKG